MQELIAQVRVLLDAYQARINELRTDIAQSPGKDSSAQVSLLNAVLQHRQQLVQTLNKDLYEFITTQKVHVAQKLNQLRQMEKSTRCALTAASAKQMIEKLEVLQKELVFIPVVIEDETRINNAYVH